MADDFGKKLDGLLSQCRTFFDSTAVTVKAQQLQLDALDRSMRERSVAGHSTKGLAAVLEANQDVRHLVRSCWRFRKGRSLLDRRAKRLPGIVPAQDHNQFVSGGLRNDRNFTDRPHSGNHHGSARAVKRT